MKFRVSAECVWVFLRERGRESRNQRVLELMKHYKMKSEFIYFSYSLYMIQIKKKNIKGRTAINIAQNLCNAVNKYVYFTCKYYGMNWNGRYLESLKYL